MTTLTLTLGCGPYLALDEPQAWMALVTFLVLKPVAYFGFIGAFRYRVNRPIPMTFGQTAKLTLARAGLGVLLLAVGAGVVMAAGSAMLLAWSWLYLYVGRIAAWFVVGKWGAVLRGRRLFGWVVSGTLINAAFDFAALAGLLEGWMWPAAMLIGLTVFIVILDRVGRRDSLKARFPDGPFCQSCRYDLTGNLSGRCPECSTLLFLDVAAGEDHADAIEITQ